MRGISGFLGVVFSAGVVWTVSCSGNDTPAGGCGVYPEPCEEDSACCSGVCAAGHCACFTDDFPCEGDSDCCKGYACIAGACQVGCKQDGARCTDPLECCGGGCEGIVGICGAPACADLGVECASSDDCCADLGCREGICQPGCGKETAVCSADGDCCGAYACAADACRRVCAQEFDPCDPVDRPCCTGSDCVAESCRPCVAPGADCTSELDCCGGSHCEDGRCSCQDTDEPCTADGECCRWLQCFDGACQCAGVGQKCSTSWDCCDSDSSCTNGECHPVLCRPNGLECSVGSDCCDGTCEDGLCCGAVGGDCTPGADTCCGTMACWEDDQKCAACGAPGEACSLDQECCSQSCYLGVCLVPAGGPCTDSVDCEPKHACEGGACCGTGNTSCGVDLFCCSAFDCNAGTCEGPPGAPCQSSTECGLPTVPFLGCLNGECCLYWLSPCTSPADCCSGLCQAGECACAPPGGPCDATHVYCCTGNCDVATGTCLCGALNDSCTAASDCCSGFDCDTGGSCCAVSGSACVSSSNCCSLSCKPNGTCA